MSPYFCAVRPTSVRPYEYTYSTSRSVLVLGSQSLVFHGRDFSDDHTTHAMKQLSGTPPRHLHGRSSCFDLPLTFCLSSPRPRLHRVRISFLWLVSFPSGLGWQLTQSRMRDWESLGSWASGFCPWRDGTPKPTTNRGKGTLRKGNGEQKGGRGQSACSIQAD